MFGYVIRLLEGRPLLASMIANRTAETVELANGVTRTARRHVPVALSTTTYAPSSQPHTTQMPPAALGLHARTLGFAQPRTGTRMPFEAPLLRSFAGL